MENKKNYSLIPGVMVLLAIIAVIAVAGYFVSRPKPMVIQGEVAASD